MHTGKCGRLFYDFGNKNQKQIMVLMRNQNKWKIFQPNIYDIMNMENMMNCAVQFRSNFNLPSDLKGKKLAQCSAILFACKQIPFFIEVIKCFESN